MGDGYGLGIGGPSHTKLSRERKHRMRELATQKLSRAYHLDEIAASVATMQSTSSLEEVAKLVLQRNSSNSDAKYVHFFHEKIPSRMLDESTSLEPLDELIRNRPADGALLRTRAVTKIFKHDLRGAVEDLTEALAVSRYMATQHRNGRNLEPLSALAPMEILTEGPRDWRYGSTIGDEEQPKSLEPQLLFQRAGIYLALACENIAPSLDRLERRTCSCQDSGLSHSEAHSHEPSCPSHTQLRSLEAHKLVKSYAKRALRDYVSFLAFFEYTSGISTNGPQEDTMKSNMKNSLEGKPVPLLADGLPNMSDGPTAGEVASADALIPCKHKIGDAQSCRGRYPHVPPLKVFQLSTLFSSTPTADLPPYPVTSQQLVKAGPGHSTANVDGASNYNPLSRHGRETITYHPLLTESLHALLLCHSLVQTSPAELLRHAHMVARLVRLCDGYPIFLAARSPSRADWIEIVRQAENWIGLEQPWESLCAPAPAPAHSKHVEGRATHRQAGEQRWQEAAVGSLANERVQNEATFQAALTAEERRAKDLKKNSEASTETAAKQWAQRDSKEYHISTERAETIARWIIEAPSSIPGSRKSKRGRRKGKAPKQDQVE